MASTMALVDAGLVLLTSFVYVYVGRVTSRRRIGGDSQLAADSFSLWWYALGAVTAVGVVNRALGFAGVTDVDVYTTMTYLTLLILCVALFGLLYYLVYLFTGNRRTLAPIAGFYAAYYVFLLYYVTLQHPIGVDITQTGARLRYETTLSGAPLVLLGLLLILPPVIGAIGYARLFLRVEAPTQRYRIGMVSFTILAWFGSSLVAWPLGVSAQPWWQGVSRLIGLFAALLILAAYRPPGWVRRRWDIHAVDEPADTTA